MKKILAIAFVGVLAISCSKKPDHSLQDSNVMLQEPASKTADSATAQQPVDQGATEVSAAASETSAPAKTDSAETK
ncbi:hypothetical protein AAH994_06560 [Weeksellaceae bacterium A-14]